MENLRPCVGCGERPTEVQKSDVIDEQDVPLWFIKCYHCDSIATIAHVVKDDAIRQWNRLWVWGEIDRLKKEAKEAALKGLHAANQLTEDQRTLKSKFEKLFDAYIKCRMEYGGSWGNATIEKRREVMVNEIMAELGWAK